MDFAGRDHITISEEGKVRACHFFPSEIQYRNIREYVGNITNGTEEDYTNDLKQLEEYLKKNNKSFMDMHCVGFRK